MGVLVGLCRPEADAHASEDCLGVEAMEHMRCASSHPMAPWDALSYESHGAQVATRRDKERDIPHLARMPGREFRNVWLLKTPRENPGTAIASPPAPLDARPPAE